MPVNADFADTSFFIALVNEHDKHHWQAIAHSADDDVGVVTTEYVIVEVGNYFRRPAQRQYFLATLALIAAQEAIAVVPASSELQNRGSELYRNRPDKDWSLTDCISFVVMEERGIGEALTADRHFEQAGSKALLG